MTYRKGAFQVSMGFIIAVVFAVIMLTLSITWIQGMFSGLSPLTHQVTDVARQNLLDELASGGGKVNLAAPAVTGWRRGETGSYSLGIRNDDTAKPKTFTVKVYLDEVGGGLTGGASSHKNDAELWLTYSKSLFLDQSAQGTVDIIIRPDAAAKPGIYLFKAIACETVSCTETTTNIYGASTFALEITG